MKLLYGTGNSAKVTAMRARLAPLGIEVAGAKDMGLQMPEADENGATPLENACIKAKACFTAFKMPVFSCDSGLYFEGLPPELQPGPRVRRVKGVNLTDEEARTWYGNLAAQYGKLTAYYQHAVCLIDGQGQMHAAMTPEMESRRFYLMPQPCGPIRRPGFPLDSMSVECESREYYYHLPPERMDRLAVEEGLLDFFRELRRGGIV